MIINIMWYTDIKFVIIIHHHNNDLNSEKIIFKKACARCRCICYYISYGFNKKGLDLFYLGDLFYIILKLLSFVYFLMIENNFLIYFRKMCFFFVIPIIHLPPKTRRNSLWYLRDSKHTCCWSRVTYWNMVHEYLHKHLNILRLGYNFLGVYLILFGCLFFVFITSGLNLYLSIVILLNTRSFFSATCVLLLCNTFNSYIIHKII